MSQSQKYIVTAALPYANGPIHIGHLLEYVQADIYSRFLRLQGKDVLYICASDMHGTPIEINATKAGKKPEDFVEHFWKDHQHDFASFGIQFDNYYKTHSVENKELSEYFFTELKKKGLIYLKDIQVMFCSTCQRTLPDRYIKGTCPKCSAVDQYGDICEKCNAVLKGVDLINPHCVICDSRPVPTSKPHYFFKLSSFSSQLSDWIQSSESGLQQEVANWLQEWINNGLEDWCISRDAPYFGFPIPDSKKETGETKYFYVWLDAPIGYISSTKNYCDKQGLDWKDYWYHGHVQHFIGKDIAYFHFLFWPAMLMGVGIPVPHLTVHGFITVNGQKMSKSRGTFFTAKQFLDLFAAYALRFYYAGYLDRSVVDVDLHFEHFKAVNNNVLMANLGNFCYRTLSFAAKNYGRVESIAVEKDMILELKMLVEEVEKYYAAQDFKNAVKTILKISDMGNVYFQTAEPWKRKEEAYDVVGLCVNIARTLAILVLPIIPTFSEKVLGALGETQLLWKDIRFDWKGRVIDPGHLVERIESVPVEKIFPYYLVLGHIDEVKDHLGAEHLFMLKVNFGSKIGIRQVLTALKKHKSRSEFEHQTLAFCLNLKPMKLRGELSEGMIVAADDGEHICFLRVEGGVVGEELVPEGYSVGSGMVVPDDFKKVPMVVEKGRVLFEGKVVGCSKGPVYVKGIKEGAGVF